MKNETNQILESANETIKQIDNEFIQELKEFMSLNIESVNKKIESKKSVSCRLNNELIKQIVNNLNISNDAKSTAHENLKAFVEMKANKLLVVLAQATTQQ